MGALTVVDAVHYALHRSIDVKDIDTDFLLCSAYKFFGPHLGVLYVKNSVGEKIKTARVMADDNTEMPWKFETGTPAMELARGAAAAVEFIAGIGVKHEEYFPADLEGLTGRRRAVVAGFYAIEIINNVLGLAEQGGVVRVGLAPYNTMDEVERTIKAVEDFVAEVANK